MCGIHDREDRRRQNSESEAHHALQGCSNGGDHQCNGDLEGASIGRVSQWCMASPNHGCDCRFNAAASVQSRDMGSGLPKEPASRDKTRDTSCAARGPARGSLSPGGPGWCRYR